MGWGVGKDTRSCRSRNTQRTGKEVGLYDTLYSFDPTVHIQNLKKNPRKDERRITFVECYRRVCQMLKTGIAREYMEDEEAYILINALLPDVWERLSKVHDTIGRNRVKSRSR